MIIVNFVYIGIWQITSMNQTETKTPGRHRHLADRDVVEIGVKRHRFPADRDLVEIGIKQIQTHSRQGSTRKWREADIDTQKPGIQQKLTSSRHRHLQVTRRCSDKKIFIMSQFGISHSSNYQAAKNYNLLLRYFKYQ